ncbi:MAG: hypothetical protein LBT62_04975 [Deltaproteobacteria bacterium]|jgi:hypothetical protein|nr:hypothetical protein [Deltaproteobacteria bacterium]
MNPVSIRPQEAFLPLQVAGTIRQTSVAAVEPTPNVASSIIASGSPKPHATVSNAMVAMVDSYTPRPGRNLAHYLAIDVDKAGNDHTSVADALQRYLNVRPTRKPSGDPKDIASNDSYPTLIIDEAQEWTDPMPYKFSVNGVIQNQNQPTFFTLGGSIRIRVTSPGVTTITTPATQGGTVLQAGPIPPGAYYPPEVAAQLSMRRLTDMFDASNDYQPLPIGGQDSDADLNETLGAVATTLAAMKYDVGPAISQNVRSGLNQFSNAGIYRDAPQLYLTAIASKT